MGCPLSTEKPEYPPREKYKNQPGRQRTLKDRADPYKAYAGIHDGHDYYRQNYEARMARERDAAHAQQPRNVQQHRTTQEGSDGGVRRPKQAKLKESREREQRRDREQSRDRSHRRQDRVEEHELQKRHHRAAEPASSRPFPDDGFILNIPLPKNEKRLSKVFPQCELNRAVSDGMGRLSTPFEPVVYDIGEYSPPPTPTPEKSREKEWESGAVQYEKQPGATAPMRYPSPMTESSFSDDGQVSPLEEDISHFPAPVYQVRQSSVFAPINRHRSQRAEVGDLSDPNCSLSDWSGETRYVESEAYSINRQISSPYGSSYRGTSRSDLSGSTRSEEGEGPYEAIPKVRYSADRQRAHGAQPRQETLDEPFEDVDLSGPSSHESLPKTDRFHEAYRMLTDTSQIEGGKAAWPTPRDSELWMV